MSHTEAAIAEAKMNLKLIEALREFLSGKLTPEDLAEFDAIWTPFLNNGLADGDPAGMGMDAVAPLRASLERLGVPAAGIPRASLGPTLEAVQRAKRRAGQGVPVVADGHRDRFPAAVKLGHL
ncbi:hypothetical protein ACE7GA_01465 [Roseomonas sp. CCTCC AB2023176]|uniref:hypothetical protein n=1 Tax=Roseomonas sp. CCTCC AB2023176 TaxID=3342640 RepID=UPI0035DBCB42